MTELLYLAEYEFVDPRMQSLVDNRHRLLGAHRVRKAYIGYAVAQAKRLQNREAAGKSGFNSDLAKRTAKHGRHCSDCYFKANSSLRRARSRSTSPTGEMSYSLLANSLRRTSTRSSRNT